MTNYPHRRHRNNIHWLFFILIAGIIAMACTKDKSKEWMEVPPADHSVKDSVDKWQGWWNNDKS